MPRLIRTLTLLLTLSLLLAACLSPQRGGPWTVDGGQPTAPSPTLTLSPSPTATLTITPTPAPPSLESLGLSPETQSMLERQGWQITWEYGRIGDSPQPGRYLISQRAWDETSQSFTSQTTHEIGYIDTEGNLHTKVTRLSATEHPDGTWTDTSTTQELVIPQIRPNASTPQPETWNLPTWNLIETKNPAFQKTGILTLTYLDENGAPHTIFYNPELGFLPKTEISTDPTTPTAMPKYAIEAYAHVQLLTLNYGDKPFPREVFRNQKNENIFPGWALQFHYYPDGTKDCILWPRSGETYKYIRFWGQEEQKIPWFITTFPNGESYITTAVEIFNPQNPQDPMDGREKLTLMVTLGKMNPWIFKVFYLDDPDAPQYLYKLAKRQLLITLAQEGGHFAKANFRNDAYDISSLDSLLGMEGRDFEKISYGNGAYTLGIVQGNWSYIEENDLTIDEILIAVDGVYVSLPLQLQGKVLVISP